MILIVADTGPINYLIQIELAEMLPLLVEKVVIPKSVQFELSRDEAPPAVRAWATHPPLWVEVRTASHPIDVKDISDADREAISLARELNAAFLLMDDSKARSHASQFGVVTMGTLGFLESAAARELISLPSALQKLRATSCFLSDELIENALQRDAQRRNKEL